MFFFVSGTYEIKPTICESFEVGVTQAPQVKFMDM
jgi:hypothetical protein